MKGVMQRFTEAFAEQLGKSAAQGVVAVIALLVLTLAR